LADLVRLITVAVIQTDKNQESKREIIPTTIKLSLAFVIVIGIEIPK